MLAAAAIADIAAITVAVDPIRRNFLMERNPVGERFRACDVCAQMIVVPWVPDGSKLRPVTRQFTLMFCPPIKIKNRKNFV